MESQGRIWFLCLTRFMFLEGKYFSDILAFVFVTGLKTENQYLVLRRSIDKYSLNIFESLAIVMSPLSLRCRNICYGRGVGCVLRCAGLSLCMIRVSLCAPLWRIFLNQTLNLLRLGSISQIIRRLFTPSPQKF